MTTRRSWSTGTRNHRRSIKVVRNPKHRLYDADTTSPETLVGHVTQPLFRGS